MNGEETTRTRMRGADRRSQILDIATQVFGVRGFRGSALRDVADACGVTEPLVYKYFRSKRELFLATVNHAAQLLNKAVEEEAGAGAKPLDKLRAIARIQDGLTEHQVGTGVLVQAAAEAGRDPEIREAVGGAFRARADMVKEQIGAAQGEGALRADVDAEGLAWQVVGILMAGAATTGLDAGFPGTTALLDRTLQRIAG